MKKYDTYKDSGIEWIGMIPEYWKCLPMKRGLTINNGKDYKDVQSEEGYPVIGSGGPFAYAKEFLYDGEAVLLGRKGTINKPIYINTKFWTVDTMFYAVPSKNVCCKYMYYQALTIPFGLYSTNTALPSMTQSELANNPMCFPPLSEQQAIASYLDHKAGQIDASISAIDKQIEDLKAYRMSVISEAVTKGLNPNAPMKDSGIDWIGEIPEGWEVTNLGWAYPNMGSGTTPDTNNLLYYVDEGYNWLQTGDLTDGAIVSTSKHLSQIAVEEKKMKFYPIGSIVIAMYGATIGKVGYLEIETSTNQACCVLPPQTNMENKFMFYMLQASNTILISKSVGGGQPNISQAIIQKHRIPSPSKEEQIFIATYLDKKTLQIDTTISSFETLREDLNALKQSIISEAVTGKIDVRDWKPNNEQ